MGLLSSKIRSEQLNPGDHIYTWRNGYSYSHHGIYVGDEQVIHLTRAPGFILSSSSHDHGASPSHPSDSDRVVRCSIEEFLFGGDLYLYKYGTKTAQFLIKRGGTCTRTTSDPPEDVLHRASILLEKGFGGYNLFHSNCEDFAIYCKTGLLAVDKSKPGRSGQIKFVYAIFLAVSLAPYKFLPSGFTNLALVVYGLYCCFIFELDRGVEKVAVEKFYSSYHPSSTVGMENGGRRMYLPVGELIVSTAWLLGYQTVMVRIAYRIRSFLFPESFDDLLTNHPTLYILGSCVVFALMVYEHWRFFRSQGAIFFWSKLGLLCGFPLLVAYDQPRLLLGFWYWTRESRILLWKRLVDFYGSLCSFVSHRLRNHPILTDLEVGEHVGCVVIWVLGYWYCDSESRFHFWTKLIFLYNFILLFVFDHPRRIKLQKYTSKTVLVLGFWYWTPESIIIIRIRLLLLQLFLFKFVLDCLRNHSSKLTRLLIACLAIQSVVTLFLGLDY